VHSGEIEDHHRRAPSDDRIELVVQLIGAADVEIAARRDDPRT
jgi:hypothetical protein